MSALLATLGVALLVVFAAISGLLLAAALKPRFVLPRTELLPEGLPADVQLLLEPGLAQLQALGFAEPAAQRLVVQRVAGAEPPQHALVLVHGVRAAAACLLQLPQADHGRRWTVLFVSRTRSGQVLITRNRASVSGPVPLANTVTQDCWVSDWPALWRAHTQRMDALRPDPARWQRLSAADWVVAGGAHEQEVFHARVGRGDLVPAGDGSYRVGLRCALVMLARAWLTARASMRRMAGDGPVAAAPGAVQDQVDGFEREAAQRQAGGGWSRRAKWLLFFATAAAAAASFGLSLDLAVVPALVAVLLFHELGHFAAMRWAGYRDLKVFFLPFLGAAVSGRHDHPTARQELIVLFAGPVPGLVLGLAVLAFGLPEGLPLADFWHSCALLAVTLNAFNLLPVHPLDGGKIFEILLLGRWPWLAFAARVLGVVGLAALAMTTETTVGSGVLWALVALMLLGLSHQRDEARLAAALRARGALGGHTRAAALQTLFGGMREVGLAHKPWPSQCLLAEALLPAMTRPPLSRGGRAGGLLVYAFFLLLPVLAAMATFGGALRGSATAQAAPTEATARPSLNGLFAELQARVDAEPDTARRWALLVESFEEQVSLLASAAPDELPAAEALLRQAEGLAAAQPDAASAQARLALWQARATADHTLRLQRLQALVARYDDAAAAPADKLLLVRSTVEWLSEAQGLEPAVQAQAIERALAQGAALPAYEQQLLREMKAEMQLARGEGDAARRETQAAFEAAFASAEPGAAIAAARLQVDVVLALDGPAAALQALDALLPRLDARQQARPDYPGALAGLRLHGLQIAEVAGRSDWQRAQARLLPPPPSASEGLPWWLRLMVRRQGPGLLELEYLHWQGDAEGAADVAAAMRKGRNGGAVTLPPGGAGAAGPLSAARSRVMVEARRAIARRYGLPVRPPG